MTMAPPVVAPSIVVGGRRRTILLVALGVLATFGWAIVVNRLLWRQPLFPYPLRFEDLREHLGDFHLVVGGTDPYYLRFRFNDTTPPLVALLYGSLANIHDTLRAMVFLTLNLACVSIILTAALRAVLRRPAAVLFAISSVVLTPLTVLVLSQAAYSGLWWGQDQILVMALIVVDLLVIPPRHRGYLIGLGVGILLAPVFFGLLLLRPDWRSTLRAAAAFLGTALLAAMVNVHASTSYWFHLLPSGEAVRRVYFTTIARQGNSSLFAFAARDPFAHHVSATALGYVLAAIVAAIGLSAAWWAQSQRLSVTAVAAVGLTTATISPVSWDHHWIWAILLPIVAIELWASHRAVAVASIVVIPLAYLRAYPATRAIPVTDPAVANLAWSAPSLVMTVLLAGLCASLWRSRTASPTPTEVSVGDGAG
jgi:alpha-1,2-mannosyltransferase